LKRRRSRWREFRFMARELAAAVSPRLGLRKVLRHWGSIAKGLASRRRKSNHR
jgi:hypothetical protein